jgi:hypothetical protein
LIASNRVSEYAVPPCAADGFLCPRLRASLERSGRSSGPCAFDIDLGERQIPSDEEVLGGRVGPARADLSEPG